MENTENYEEIKAEEFLRRLYLAATCEKEIMVLLRFIRTSF